MSESVKINTNKSLSTINRDIYGHFAEHLGRCIYGGFWVGKDSPIENIEGYRKDVVEAFKKIRIPNLRWPGGCFADEYHWKDGIGPQSQRKRMINTNWGGVVEDNSFGTHEFMRLCELLDCKPYICGNVGSGTVQEMSEWVEYITFSGESPMSKLREANGHKEAWKLPMFGVGNENWGCGGNMRAEFYADQYRRYQTFVRQYGEDKIYKIAGGANSSDYNWTEVLMREAGRFMDGLSVHNYTFEYDWDHKGSATEFDEKAWYSTLKNAFGMDALVARHAEIMDKYDPAKRVGLIVDEWGTWHKVEPGTNPGFLYQQNTVRDAMVAGVVLNIFNNHSDRVQGANLAQAVNVLMSPVLTEGDKIVLTPTWHVLDMYKDHQGADLLETSYTSSTIDAEGFTIPGLSVSASVVHGTQDYTVTVCNPDLHQEKTIVMTFDGLKGSVKKAEGKILAGESMNSYNSFENPETVVAKDITVKITGKDSIEAILPAASVFSVTVHA